MKLSRTVTSIVLVAVGIGASVLASEPAGAAVANGCTAARPTYVGGTIRGSDGRYVDANIGVDLNANGQKITPAGTPVVGMAYSWIEYPNTTTPTVGTTDPAGVTDKWGQCVAATATQVFIEAYPKAPGEPTKQVTDFSRYGATAYYFGPVKVGATNLFSLRLPVITSQGGNTGGVQGYLWHNGQAVPSSAITRVRAFSQQHGSACGIEGLAASARQLTSVPGRTYYKVDYLAAGQCWAPYQRYNLYFTCTNACGKPRVDISVPLNITRGTAPRVDINF